MLIILFMLFALNAKPATAVHSDMYPLEAFTAKEALSASECPQHVHPLESAEPPQAEGFQQKAGPGPLPTSEPPPPVYMQISYLSVPADHLPQLLSYVRQYLLPAQMERVKSGAILDWNLYEALITGPDYEYNVVSVTKTTKYGELFGEWSDFGEQTVKRDPEQPGMQNREQPKDYAEEHNGFGADILPGLPGHHYVPIRPRYSEIWVMQGAALMADTGIDQKREDCRFPDCMVIAPPSVKQNPDLGGLDGVKIRAFGKGGVLPSGNYITKNFMDTRGSSGEHFSLELDFWRPIHHVRIDGGILNSWAMYTLSKPGGSSRKYTYSTIDYYDRLADIEGFDSRELAGVAHPGMTDEEISDWMNRTGPSRTAWKTELWRRVAGTFAN